MIDPRSPDYATTPASPERAAFGYAPAGGVTSPQVSIICPFYNGAADHFDETATSVFRQSFQNWEFLIVNDQATNPAALALLDRYRNIDPRVRVIDHTENKGLSGARNTAFAAARAEYVMLLDDDDLLEPTAVEKMLWHLESYPEFAVANGWSVAFGAKEFLWPAGFEGGEKLLYDNSATGRAMVRKTAHAAAGGYDESIRQGMEDWDFWLRLANQGLWGSTIPEYLDWYRRRENHKDRWADLDGADRFRRFCDGLKQRYPRLYAGGFPKISLQPERIGDSYRSRAAIANPLAKQKHRLLLIVPWLTVGGADKFNLDLVEQLRARGWELTIVTTGGGDHGWAPQFGRLTPDIFALHTFLRPRDYPAFLRYLIESREPEVVMIGNSDFGYRILPWLRAACPQPAYVDYLHSDTPNSNAGGYPRVSVGCQGFLDHTFVASEYLKGWMERNGADAGRIDVVRINIDSRRWSPDAAARSAVRSELGIANSEPVVTFVGRLHEDKQPQILAGIFRTLVEDNVRFKGIVVGDGPERESFERALAQHGLGKTIRVLGSLSSDRVREIMQASDILVLTSLWEGIALTLYEAMSIGLAVVAADVGGQRELVTPDTGVLVTKSQPDREIARYATVIERLIRDPEERARLGAAARERIRSHFDLAIMGDAMNRGLRTVIEARRVAAARPISETLARDAAQSAVDLLRPILGRDQSCADSTGGPAGAVGLDEEAYRRTMAESELAFIENSRSWKALCALKRSWPYRALGRMRFGPNWSAAPPADPCERLRRIRNSNVYRLLRRIKGTSLYGWYAKRKYGENWDQSPAFRS